MSCPINVVDEAQQGRPISVTDVAPGDTTLVATGQRGIPVLIAPLQSQSDGRARGATAQEMSMGFHGFLLLEHKDDDNPEAQRKKWFKEMRGWLMVLATVAASVTYQAGLNPPGGFWQDGRHAGNPVLHDRHWSRYMIFYYLNATAFVTSLVIMVLLMSERFYHTEAKVVALMLTTFIDLISLIGAYIAGTTRFFSSCIYIIVIACVAFAGVIYIGEVMAEICRFFMRRMPCMSRMVQSKWFPVPAEVVKSLQPHEERISQTQRTARSNQRGGCSACCASAPRAEG
ncbi:hypothetical protein GQ55_4G232200 [Panicum hallii var. hallii]|uniref:PGG domain-containing protein n=2 Tax=Panicum hallii TaxID=206008 RepID=A0A2T7DZK6_9POAL|nr:uncharacterized protein LOC112890965 [Panicum hallii]PAN24377.1 hypothetical protein PAHAL_4G211700 [Panicum hallii]PUZ60987.1 hypothetical protein GQ55_4G232200 [Panicum hallii var. hallii]